VTYSWAVQNPLRLGRVFQWLCNVDVPGDVCVAKTQTLHVAVMQSAEKRMRRYVDRNRGDRSMPTCRKVISPSSTRLIAWPPCVCQDVHSPGGKSTTSCTTSACKGAFVTPNRDSATTLRRPPWIAGIETVWPRTAIAGVAAIRVAMVRTRRLAELRLFGTKHPLFVQRAITIVVQALSSLGSSRLVAICTSSLRSPPRTTGQ